MKVGLSGFSRSFPLGQPLGGWLFVVGSRRNEVADGAAKVNERNGDVTPTTAQFPVCRPSGSSRRLPRTEGRVPLLPVARLPDVCLAPRTRRRSGPPAISSDSSLFCGSERV